MINTTSGEEIDVTKRDLRQRNQFPPERLAKTRVTVIGNGGIGRNVALMLATIGVSQLVLIDNDTVEVVNCANQGFYEDQIGMSKVDAVAEIAKRANPRIHLELFPELFRAGQLSEYGFGEDGFNEIIVCCVDSIETRGVIHEILGKRADVWIDTRMSAEIARVFTSTPATYDEYRKTLFTAAEAYNGACAAQSTNYTCNICAGLAVTQFSKYLRSQRLDPDVSLNLLGMDLIYNGGV